VKRVAHLSLLFLIVVIASSVAFAQAQGQEQEQPPPVYDESADAAADIAAALDLAKTDNTRVLIQWGANWCGWCKLLHQLFNEDRQIGRKILYEYEVVYVDMGRFDKNLDLVEKFGAEIKSIPYLTILDSNGGVVINQHTEPLEEGSVHSPERVLEFLTAHEAEYLQAEELLADALVEAGREGKRLFLTFGAPW